MKIPWRRKWQSTPVLLPGKSHGWRSLIGYSPWGRKESDTTEQLHFFSLSHPKQSRTWSTYYLAEAQMEETNREDIKSLYLAAELVLPKVSKIKIKKKRQNRTTMHIYAKKKVRKKKTEEKERDPPKEK